MCQICLLVGSDYACTMAVQMILMKNSHPSMVIVIFLFEDAFWRLFGGFCLLLCFMHGRWELSLGNQVPFVANPMFKMCCYSSMRTNNSLCWPFIFSPIEHRTGRITFNDFDKKARISRISFEGQYGVKEGLPLNPRGRTGVEGRGMLGRWGPNIAGDPLVTRWVWICGC